MTSFCGHFVYTVHTWKTDTVTDLAKEKGAGRRAFSLDNATRSVLKYLQGARPERLYDLKPKKERRPQTMVQLETPTPPSPTKPQKEERQK